MENKKLKTLIMVALIVSILPLATLVPAFVLLGLLLSVICVRNEESRSTVNIVSTAISALWLLMMVGIVVLALFINFVQ